jgi:hypothetical protein
MSFTIKQFRRWLGAMFASPDTIVLGKVKDWLEEEMSDYQEHADDIGDVDSFDDGILEGRHEAATNLLDQIRKWEGQ